MDNAQSRALRLCLCLAGLAAAIVGIQFTVTAHQTRVRGLPDGFPAPVTGADVPMPGVNVALEQYDDEELATVLNRVVEGGFVWVRQPFIWSQIEPQPGRFDWTVPDRILAALERHPQLRVVAVLDDSPPIPPADPDRFASFAGAFAARYGAQVDYYQIWDEPNLADHWGGNPVNPPAYADLLARTAQAIRAADHSDVLDREHPAHTMSTHATGPDVTILLASLAPTAETGPRNLSDVRYLEQLYEAGAAPYFDLESGKPYGFYTGPDDRRADEDVLNFSRLLLLREVMVEHDDADKAIWASHWGWNALPAGWTGTPSIWGQTTEAIQATRTARALERARNEWPWVGALILDHLQPVASEDDPRWGFALLGSDGQPRPVYDAVAARAAALPDGAPVGGYPALNSWATYGDGWRMGPLGADISYPKTSAQGTDGSRASFRFTGSAVALTVRRGPYRAFLYVTVDGEPANGLPQDESGRAYLVLYDSTATLATVPLATGLSPGPHTVEIEAEGGQGQWALVDWRVGAEPVRDGYRLKMAGLIAAGLGLITLLAREARRLDWDALQRALLSWSEWAQAMLAVGLTGLLWATAGASWGRDWSSPWFVVSLLTLPALAALFTLRIDLGLGMVALAAPFYLHPGHTLYHALSLPEVLVALCGVAALVRGVRKPQSRHRQTPWIGGRALRSIGVFGETPDEDRKPAFTPLDRAVFLLVTAAAVAGLAADDLGAALFELRTVFLFPAFYYVLIRLASLDNRARRRMVDGLVIGAVGVAAIGLVQYALRWNVAIAEGGLPRLQSVYYSPNNVGLYLGRAWPIMVTVALLGMRGRRRALYRAALAPVTLALVLSFSRGALLLGLPAAFLVIVWRASGDLRTAHHQPYKGAVLMTRRWRWAALALLLVGVLVLIPLLRVPRFASMFDLREGSTFFRLELWRSSLTLLREHPWFGVGPGNFQATYRTRYVLPSAWQEFNLEHPHDIYLDHWTRLGILGLLAGGAVQVAFWRRMRHHTRSILALGLAGQMAALLAHGLVDNTVFFPDLALAFFLMLGLANQVLPESKE